MGYSNILTKRGRVIAAFSLLFFIVYCSAGVCTNLLSVPVSDGVVVSGVDHSQHMSTDSKFNEHCDNGGISCEWSVNPVADPIDDATPLSSFFFLFALGVTTLLFNLRPDFRQRIVFLFAFARQQFFQRSFPRLHIQQAVFLN